MKFVGRTGSEPGEIKLDGDLLTRYGQTPVEDDMQHQSEGLASEALVEANRTVFLQPPPIQVGTPRQQISLLLQMWICILLCCFVRNVIATSHCAKLFYSILFYSPLS